MRRFIFYGFFFLRELSFADRGQSAKFAKIRTRKIFMLHGNFFSGTKILSVLLTTCMKMLGLGNAKTDNYKIKKGFLRQVQLVKKLQC